MREKMVELIKQIVIPFWAGQIADHLISNDVVPVVRCRDCVYGEEAEKNDKGFLICPASGMEITDDDFCSYGARKDGDS